MIEAGPGDYMIADAYRDQVAVNVINRDNLANLVASVRQQAEDAMRERCAAIAEGQKEKWGHHAYVVATADSIATAIRGIDAGGEG